nr:O-antigen ligase family protein [Vibrio marinisediminis]
MGLLIWLPIPLGSNRVWAWTIAEVWIGVSALVLLTSLYQYQQGQVLTRLKQFSWLLLPIALFQLWTLCQIIPIPLSWLGWLSPAASQAYQATGADLGYVSLDPRATYISLLKGLFYLIFVLCCTLLINSRERIRMAMLALIVSGTLQALYAAINVLLGIEQSLVFGLQETGIATGSFVYKNHLANYLVLCLSMGIGLIVVDMQSYSASYNSWQHRLQQWLQLFSSQKTLIRLALVIMVVALVMTRSRMGNAAFLGSTLVVGFIAITCYKNRPTKLTWLLLSLLVVDIVIMGSLFGLDKLQQRIVESHIEQGTRHLVIAWSIPMIKDYLLTGTGLGSFYGVFPSYTQQAIGYYDHAHNEYVQFVAEAGLPATLMLGGMLLWAFGLSIWVMSHRNSQTCKGAAFGGLIALCAMLVHIWVDFNLQAPANTVTFLLILVLIGASYSIPSPPRRKVVAHV